MTTHTHFHGVYPILYSFFDEHGALDRAAQLGAPAFGRGRCA